MTIVPAPRLVTELKPKYEVKVDLDDRCFLFPAGKPLAQLSLLSDGKLIFVEAVFPFNQSRTPPRLLTLELEDAQELARGLIQAVHYAQDPARHHDRACGSRSTWWRTAITCRSAT